LAQGVGLAVIAKKFRHHRISGMIKLQNSANEIAAGLEK
jgi:hypothetical protein